MRLCIPILWLALASQSLAQDKDKILIPDPPVATPAAGTPIVLTPDLIYLVQFDSPLIVLSSPEGVVSVSQLRGPRTWTGKFVDSPDKSQDRELAAKFIYRVQPLLTGRCELLVIPSGSTDAKAVVHRLIDAQTAPLPPPVPPGPVPPVPPGPTPPGPTPTPAPIPVDGFRSLIVYESADLSKLSKEQLAALYSQQVRDYLTSKCAMGADGKTKDWRTWDKDVDTTNEAKLWQDAMKRPRQSLPWIILSDGKKGFEGPLPKTEAELLTLVKSIGG